jgi:hypothetical protein
VVIRRSALDAAGPFEPRIGASSTDWHMWLRVALRGSVAYRARPVARYRQHGASISRATAPSGQRLRCDVRVAADVLRRAPRGGAPVAKAALAAKALLHAGDAYTRGYPGAAADAVALAGRLRPGDELDELLAATRGGDDLGCARLTKRALARLDGDLGGTRFGRRVRRAAASDPAWDAELSAAARAVARVTPQDAVVAAIAKWDPALLAGCGRAGCNYPDRELLPDGYPEDGRAAAAHLGELRARRGVTHLVVPATNGWWLEHYPELALAAGDAVHRDGACAIFDLRAR